MMMTNGLGATVGSLVAQAVVTSRTALDGSVDWAPCWHSFALYALVVGVLFALVFRYKTEKQS